ncbi:MAG TPA: acetyl-CoA carboxylase biotin carboxyl carrier protein [Bacteroidales bacterium]|nr:acetyl-CoA carboxylase biotin carboxyl carrier protein [Bacteroidales bacterium]
MEKIKLEDILKILEQFEKSSIDSLRYKTGEEEIELSRHKNGGSDTANIQGANLEQLKSLIQQAEGQASETKQQAAEEKDQPEASVEQEKEQLHSVISPIIGTFYSSPAPGKSAFVKPGDHVKKGDVLCIVEAMKVMNKIESDVSGEVVRIVAEDGQSVEYGTELVKIREH